MGLTPAMLTARGLLPAAPFRKLIEDWDEAHTDYRKLEGNSSLILGNVTQIAHLCGLPRSLIEGILSGKQENIGFDRADAIVSRLCEYGWRETDELYAIYATFDLSGLDKSKPCSRLAA